jgi:heme-degrading monooxygenase HmoA
VFGMRGTAVYTMVERRIANTETMEETVQRAGSEFFPKLQAAPGFIGFYLVSDEPNGINTAIVVWESKAAAEAFDAASSAWLKALDELGHTLQSENRGETVIQLEPTK